MERAGTWFDHVAWAAFECAFHDAGPIVFLGVSGQGTHINFFQSNSTSSEWLREKLPAIAGADPATQDATVNKITRDLVRDLLQHEPRTNFVFQVINGGVGTHFQLLLPAAEARPTRLQPPPSSPFPLRDHAQPAPQIPVAAAAAAVRRPAASPADAALLTAATTPARPSVRRQDLRGATPSRELDWGGIPLDRHVGPSPSIPRGVSSASRVSPERRVLHSSDPPETSFIQHSYAPRAALQRHFFTRVNRVVHARFEDGTFRHVRMVQDSAQDCVCVEVQAPVPIVYTPQLKDETDLPEAFSTAVCASVGTHGLSARLLLLQSAVDGIALVQLPTLDNVSQDGAPRVLHAVRVGLNDVLSLGHVIDARWHPLSDRHFCTLSSDDSSTNAFRVWDASALMRGMPCSSLVSELRFPPHSFHGASPTAFAYGCKDRGWEALTVFILSSDGGIFSLCPILPPGVGLLTRDVRALRSALELRVQTSASRAWIDECFHAENDKGGGDEYVVYSPRGFKQSPTLQGPIRVFPGAAISPKSTGYADLAAVSASASPSRPALALLANDGRLAVIVGADAVGPSFSTAPLANGYVDVSSARRLRELAGKSLSNVSKLAASQAWGGEATVGVNSRFAASFTNSRVFDVPEPPLFSVIAIEKHDSNEGETLAVLGKDSTASSYRPRLGPWLLVAAAKLTLEERVHLKYAGKRQTAADVFHIPRFAHSPRDTTLLVVSQSGVFAIPGIDDALVMPLNKLDTIGHSDEAATEKQQPHENPPLLHVNTLLSVELPAFVAGASVVSSSLLSGQKGPAGGSVLLSTALLTASGHEDVKPLQEVSLSFATADSLKSLQALSAQLKEADTDFLCVTTKQPKDSALLVGKVPRDRASFDRVAERFFGEGARIERDAELLVGLVDAELPVTTAAAKVPAPQRQRVVDDTKRALDRIPLSQREQFLDPNLCKKLSGLHEILASLKTRFEAHRDELDGYRSWFENTSMKSAIERMKIATAANEAAKKRVQAAREKSLTLFVRAKWLSTLEQPPPNAPPTALRRPNILVIRPPTDHEVDEIYTPFVELQRQWMPQAAVYQAALQQFGAHYAAALATAPEADADRDVAEFDSIIARIAHIREVRILMENQVHRLREFVKRRGTASA